MANVVLLVLPSFQYRYDAPKYSVRFAALPSTVEYCVDPWAYTLIVFCAETMMLMESSISVASSDRATAISVPSATT